ncbi:hypothetical protein RB195_006164 [Necator americanus]|uniref:Uncharacterized protein n=1 Tax=Necator americanus TaxID=51031 RepID=A0ABR1BU93_NECAM
MCSCVSLAIIDLEMYNFGLYIVLLCIVGTMLACALCIANPQACPNPEWYTRFCFHLHEMYPVPEDGTSSPKMTGLRARMQQHTQSMIGQSEDSQRLPLSEIALSKHLLQFHIEALVMHTHTEKHQIATTSWLHSRQESRATVAMLAPAVHIMHQVWKGMAWVAEGIEDEEEENHAYDKMEQGPSCEFSGNVAFKRLSTIAETSSNPREIEPVEEISSEINSRNDVTL